MAISWSDLRSWSPDGLEEAYQLVLNSERHVESAADVLVSAKTNFVGEGQAADAFRGIVDRYRIHTDDVEAKLVDFLLALNYAAEAVEQLAIDVLSAQAEIDSLRFTVDDASRVQIPDWLRDSHDGEDASPEEQSWRVIDPLVLLEACQHRMQKVVDALISRAEEIDTELADRCGAISEGNVSDAASGNSRTQGSGVDYPSLVEELQSLTAAEVRAMWDALDANAQRNLREQFPDIIGNLSGIPLSVRKRANDVNMQIELEKLEKDYSSEDISTRIQELQDKKSQDGRLGNDESTELRTLLNKQARRQALRDMLEGDGAITFLPSENRVIAIAGDLTKSPDYVLTHVPGTNASTRSFANGGIRDLTVDLVAGIEEQGSSAVGFVVKDGDWPVFLGEDSSALHSVIENLGQAVNRLDEDLRVEDFSSDPKDVLIGHSAGVSIGSAAETQGAHYDEVVSLGGSFLVSSWESDPTTEYTHIQYDKDAINLVERFDLHTLPRESEDFENTILDGQGRDGFDGHNRISQGKGSNPDGYSAILDEIVEEGR